jgi:hypothetical protein
MSPIEPRTAGSLKGFGFTVTWGDDTLSGERQLSVSSPAATAIDRGDSAPSVERTPETLNPVPSAGQGGGEDSGTLDSLSADNANFKRVQILGPVR